MGSEFIQKHKKKGLLALLLLLFRGRAKYFLPILLIIGASVPFIATSENFSKMIEFPPVASFLKLTGLSKAFFNAGAHGGYSAKDLKAAFAKGKTDGKTSSFWTKLFQRTRSNKSAAHSSIAMITGTDILKGEARSKRQEARSKRQEARSKKGAAAGGKGQEALGGGNNADSKGILPDIAGLMSKNGLLGNIMGDNLADRSGGGGSSGYNRGSPYMNKDLMAMNVGVADKNEGKYDGVLDKTAKTIPLAGDPNKVKKRRMGKASGFSWRNAGYKKRKSNTDIKGGADKRAMFQLAETFSTTASAYEHPDSTYEYQASYVGSTYDGNDANVDIIDTGGSTAVPDSSFTSGLLSSVGQSQAEAQECMDAQAVQGANMSRDGEEIDKRIDDLGSPPDCCDHGAVAVYNSKLDGIKIVCEDFNVNAGILSEKCRGFDQKMNCVMYESMKVDPCDCDDFGGFNWLAFIFFVIVIIIIIVLVVVGFLTSWLGIGLGLLALAAYLCSLLMF